MHKYLTSPPPHRARAEATASSTTAAWPCSPPSASSPPSSSLARTPESEGAVCAFSLRDCNTLGSVKFEVLFITGNKRLINNPHMC